MLKKLTVVFAVAPKGGGKTEQGEILHKEFGFQHMDTGNLVAREKEVNPDFRQEVSRFEQEMGVSLSGSQDKPTILLPDRLVVPVVLRYIDALPSGSRLYSNGFPRTWTQAQQIFDFLYRQGCLQEEIITLHITLSHAEAADRRRQRGRPDDTEAGIKRGEKEYEREIRPLLGCLRNHTQYVEIPGSGTKEDVALRIREALGLVRQSTSPVSV